MNELALFAGGGGGILGGKILGWRTRCAVEIDPYARRVLLARQRDGVFDPFPIWDDVRTFDGKPWRGHIDIVSGGFPCQDISQAGRGAGIEGARSGLWAHMARIVGEVGPAFVWVENSPLLVGRGLSRVLGDLAEMGYDAVWGVVGAGHAAALHIRERIWILAYTDRGQILLDEQHHQAPHADPGGDGSDRQVDTHPDGFRQLQPPRSLRQVGDGPGDLGEDVAHPDSLQQHGRRRPVQVGGEWSPEETGDHAGARGITWPPEPGMGRVAYGVANRAHRIRALGNGQVPRVVALAWKILAGLTS